MEEGSLRADVNVSVRRHGEPFRTRCEVKNVNSIRFVMQAIEAEARRQVGVWEGGRHGRAGDAAVSTRRAARPARCAARRTRTTTAISPTPICCRWCWTRRGSAELKRGAARAAGCQARPVHARLWPARLRCGRAGGRAGDCGFLRGWWRAGRDAKLAANWMMGDFFAALTAPARRSRPARCRPRGWAGCST